MICRVSTSWRLIKPTLSRSSNPPRSALVKLLNLRSEINLESNNCCQKPFIFSTISRLGTLSDLPRLSFELVKTRLSRESSFIKACGMMWSIS